MKSNNEKEFLLIKVKSPDNIDFGESHKDVIKRNGYVDFAKFGNSILKTERLKSGDVIYIKESMKNGGKLFKGTLKEIISDGTKYPDYYEDYLNKGVIWVRLSSLELIDDKDYLKQYETRAGGEVERALKSISPHFYIKKKSED